MSKKNILIAVCIVVAILIVGYVAVWKEVFMKKYSINGSISQCTSNNKIVYQYTANSRYSQPQHYSQNGQFIPCQFSASVPSPSCKAVLSSLKGCHTIYNTNKDWHNSPAVYTSEADQALRVLKGKVR